MLEAEVHNRQQQAFDLSSVGLIRQNRRSTRFDTRTGGGMISAYRGNGGCRCAIGHIIPDDEYSPEMENVNVCFIVTKFPVPSLQGLDNIFLNAVQQVHDCGAVERWPLHFQDIANRYQLSTAAMNLALTEMSK